jgi:hypothetical protein
MVKAKKILKGIGKVVKSVHKAANTQKLNPYIRTVKRVQQAGNSAVKGNYNKSYHTLKQVYKSGDARRMGKDFKKMTTVYKTKFKELDNKQKLKKVGKVAGKYAKEWALHGGLSGMAERGLGLKSNGFISKSGQMYLESLL